MDFRIPGSCGLQCALCDCRDTPSEVSVLQALSPGVARFVVRGGVEDSTGVASAVHAARDAGVERVLLRSPLQRLESAQAAATLRQTGVDGVLVPCFSADPRVHDRITGKRNSLAQTLLGMRAAAEAGMRVELEVPLLPARLQNLGGVVELARRAIGTPNAVHLQLPTRRVAEPLDPGGWSELAPRLREALIDCVAQGVEVVLPVRSGIPFCALGASADLQALFKRRPGHWRLDGQAQGHACGQCAAKRDCSGVRDWHLERHGMTGLVPWKARPAPLRNRSNSPQRVWTERQRDAARASEWLIIRPTVNCNQDCVFCSVNETAKNHWEDPGKTFRAIARAARRGVRRVNFTGGEPTLSPHLADFIEVAKRCGIPEIDLCTNAISLTSTTRVDRLVRAGLTHAFVSLHAHDEDTSRLLTLKSGDFERTLRGTRALIERGVQVTINHVINERNYRYLSRFVDLARERLEGKTLLSFTMITPQYRAQENIALVPRLSDVSPHLMRAALRCLEVGQPFYIGARQGTPPCFLGPFEAWSDILSIENEAVSEDAEQKVRGPQCDACRYSAQCTGIWRPYAERYGLDELKPVPGAPIDREEYWRGKTGDDILNVFPRSFSEAPEVLRDRDAEARLQEQLSKLSAPTPKHLPVLNDTPNARRPLRALMFGSARRARALSEAVQLTPKLVLDAVVSPHMEDILATTFDASGWRDAASALEVIDPDCVLIAAAPRAHLELARQLVALAKPLLLSAPLGETLADAQSLVELTERAGVRALVAHDLLFAPGLLDFLQRAHGHVRIEQRSTPKSALSPTSWDRQALGRLLYDVSSLGAQAIADEQPVLSARFSGTSQPRSIEIELRGPPRVTLAFDFESSKDELEVSDFALNAPLRRWSGGERAARVAAAGADLPERVTGPGLRPSLLRHFVEVARGVRSPLVPPRKALLTRRIVSEALDLLQQAGVSFRRGEEPKHVAMKDLVPRVY